VDPNHPDLAGAIKSDSLPEGSFKVNEIALALQERSQFSDQFVLRELLSSMPNSSR
jgi:hypothetical protein